MKQGSKAEVNPIFNIDDHMSALINNELLMDKQVPNKYKLPVAGLSNGIIYEEKNHKHIVFVHAYPHQEKKYLMYQLVTIKVQTTTPLSKDKISIFKKEIIIRDLSIQKKIDSLDLIEIVVRRNSVMKEKLLVEVRQRPKMPLYQATSNLTFVIEEDLSSSESQAEKQIHAVKINTKKEIIKADWHPHYEDVVVVLTQDQLIFYSDLNITRPLEVFQLHKISPNITKITSNTNTNHTKHQFIDFACPMLPNVPELKWKIHLMNDVGEIILLEPIVLVETQIKQTDVQYLRNYLKEDKLQRYLEIENINEVGDQDGTIKKVKQSEQEYFIVSILNKIKPKCSMVGQKMQKQINPPTYERFQLFPIQTNSPNQICLVVGCGVKNQQTKKNILQISVTIKNKDNTYETINLLEISSKRSDAPNRNNSLVLLSDHLISNKIYYSDGPCFYILDLTSYINYFQDNDRSGMQQKQPYKLSLLFKNQIPIFSLAMNQRTLIILRKGSKEYCLETISTYTLDITRSINQINANFTGICKNIMENVNKSIGESPQKENTEKDNKIQVLLEKQVNLTEDKINEFEKQIERYSKSMLKKIEQEFNEIEDLNREMKGIKQDYDQQNNKKIELTDLISKAEENNKIINSLLFNHKENTSSLENCEITAFQDQISQFHQFVENFKKDQLNVEPKAEKEFLDELNNILTKISDLSADAQVSESRLNEICESRSVRKSYKLN